MDNRRRNAIYSLVLVVVLIAVWTYRNNTDDAKESPLPYTLITGEAQGTTYSITYQDSLGRNFKLPIDSILLDFDKALSTYRTNSEISYFNQPENDTLTFKSKYFYPVLESAEKIYKASDGAFDPTIYPLIKAWNITKGGDNLPDSALIESIKENTGFDKINYNKQAVWTENKAIGLNFNASAQGYAIDVLFSFLKKQDIKNMMIELGGEVRAAGLSSRDEPWSIGIDNPQYQKGKEKRAAIIKVKDEAISTSGNYRNFFTRNGVTYGHTIDPRTGYPVQKDIISATVLAETCMEADAWSTAFMVLGMEESKKILTQQTNLKVYFIYVDESGTAQNYYSDNLAPIITVEQ